MICDRLDTGRYVTESHVFAHADTEDFVLADVRAAIRSGIIIEVYPDRDRCLIVARVRTRAGRERWLHVVCDHGHPTHLGIVTAYSPDPGEWGDPPLRRRPTE
jgi:hypothetical protein